MRIVDSKKEKQDKLLQSAFDLYTTEGIKNTSISDITSKAKVAKGTFYLYFKDKYELRDVLISKYSHKLFSDAYQAMQKSYIQNFQDQIIFIINYVIDQLIKNPLLLKFIANNLSWGVYSQEFTKIMEEKDDNLSEAIIEMFENGCKENNLKIENPKVTFFMIVELASSTVYNSIVYKRPLPIEEFKPYLYAEIRKMIS